MAIMAEQPATLETAVHDSKAGPVPAPDAMLLDAPINGNGTNGHIDAPINKFANGDGGHNEDVNMEDAEPLPNGKKETPATVAPTIAAQGDVTTSLDEASYTTKPNDGTEPITKPPTSPSQEPSSVPLPIEQPTSDTRHELVEPTDTTTEGAEQDTIISGAPALDAHPTLVPSIEDSKELARSPSQGHAEPPTPVEETTSQVEPSSTLPSLPSETQPAGSSAQDSTIVPQPDSMVARATGQVRPRDEDDEMEPSAKRPKVENADGDGAQRASPDVGGATASPANAMPPPPLPSAVDVDFGSSLITKVQHRYLVEAIRKAKKIKAALAFLAPVDPIALNIPTYPTIISQPMDIGTIEEKLKGEKYASPNEFWADFKLMVQNAITFNGQEHPISQNAMNLRQYFAKLMQTMPKEDASILVQKKKPVAVVKTDTSRRPSRTAATPKEATAPTLASVSAASALPAAPPAASKLPAPTKQKDDGKKHEAFLDANGVPLIRRDSQSERPKREIIKPPPRDLLYSTAKPKKKQFQLELQFCEKTMKELKKAKHSTFSYPFMNPVDPVALNIPTYHKVIKKPMDFGTIDKNLQAGAYGNAKEFFNDAKLVFANCYKFNLPGDSVHDMGKQFEKLFDDQWAEKDEWIATNQPPPESEAESSEEEEEDDEEEEEEEDIDEPMRKMMQLQQQIAALSAEVINLTNAQASKVKPKKKDKTKVKTEPVKKQKRPSTGNVAAQTKTPKGTTKPKKEKKEKKAKKLTLEQKQFVSDGISQLEEPDMRKAVQMIRNGVPKLKHVNDDELELDVDEIPEAVLQDLYVFVKALLKKNKPGSTAAPDDDDYQEPEPPKPAVSHRKKNKPMSAREQESKIEQVKQQLSRFSGNQSGSDPGNNAQDDSSEEDSSSSEEE